MAQPKMTLEQRVNQATLVVLGTLEPPASWSGRKRIGGTVTVHQILFGSLGTNRTIHIDYRRSDWMDPWVFSRTWPLPTTNSRCIFFLTSAGVAGSSAMKDLLRPVGPSGYIHDGLELVDAKTLKQTKELIERRRKSK